MAIKLRGKIQCEQAPGYPKIVETDEDITIEDKYAISPVDLLSLPNIGERYHGDLPVVLGGERMLLRERRFIPKPGKIIYDVELLYGLVEEDDGGSPPGISASTICEYTTEEVDVPLEQHDNYRIEWNHVLLRKNGETATWGSEGNATDLIIPSTLQKIYKWAKPGDSIPEGWSIFHPETKPGVESFRRGVAVVSVTKKARSRKAFEMEAKTDYTRQDPPITFGHTGEWLRGGSRIIQEGKKWAMTVQYTNSKKIDPDLYQ